MPIILKLTILNTHFNINIGLIMYSELTLGDSYDAVSLLESFLQVWQPSESFWNVTILNKPWRIDLNRWSSESKRIRWSQEQYSSKFSLLTLLRAITVNWYVLEVAVLLLWNHVLLKTKPKKKKKPKKLSCSKWCKHQTKQQLLILRGSRWNFWNAQTRTTCSKH